MSILNSKETKQRHRVLQRVVRSREKTEQLISILKDSLCRSSVSKSTQMSIVDDVRDALGDSHGTRNSCL